KPILLLGRHQECDIQLNSRKVSRRHCCIAHISNHLVVRDLGSTNGIRINGVRVLEGILKTGDELTIGNFRYKVEGDALALDSPRPKHVAEAKKETPVATKSPGPFDDAVLEECEEPVALTESGNRPREVVAKKARTPSPNGGANPPDSKGPVVPDQHEP